MDQRTHEVVLRRDQLVGKGQSAMSMLVSRGLDMESFLAGADEIVTYLQEAKPDRAILSVTRNGWHGDAFVLGESRYGRGSDRLVHLGDRHAGPQFDAKGSVPEWIGRLGRYCQGNSRLVMAVCMAYAAPLLQSLRLESGGIHLVGESSIGKTTAALVALSVMGHPEDLKQLWWSTVNGLAATAIQYNDLLLNLDELGQVPPRTASEAAYMLANGRGKLRSRSNGQAQNTESWKLLFLSTGEIGLCDHLQEAGINQRTGQQVRFIDLPADGGCGMGIFEELHGVESPVILSEMLIRSSKEVFGVPFRTFVDRYASWVTPEIETELRQKVRGYRQELAGAESDGQVLRVAERFALLAVAGELATEWDLTGWRPDEPLKAIRKCFEDWVLTRGGESAAEQRLVVERVRSFLTEHDSGFHIVGAESPETQGAAGLALGLGLKQNHQGQMRYYLLPDVYQERVCGGLDPRKVTRYLLDAGVLIKGSDGKNQTAKRWIDGETRRAYCLVPPGDV